MDLILMIIFCYLLYRVAKEKGVSPVSYILNYFIMVMAMMFLLAFGLLTFYGAEIFKTQQGIQIAVLFESLAIFFEIFLFFFFKKRIEKIQWHDEDGNEHSHHTPPDGKKDLSYFR